MRWWCIGDTIDAIAHLRAIMLIRHDTVGLVVNLNATVGMVDYIEGDWHLLCWRCRGASANTHGLERF